MNDPNQFPWGIVAFASIVVIVWMFDRKNKRK